MSKLNFKNRQLKGGKTILQDLLCLTNGDLVVYSYNLKLKLFQDKLLKAVKYSYTIQKNVALDLNKHNGCSSIEQLEHYKKMYLKHVKQEILDLALNNQDKWEYFITLTFNDVELGGTYSHEKAITKLKNWLIVQRRNNPNMHYLMVPEFHKSGRLHFHGLVGNVSNWELEKARKNGKLIRVNGKQIYNLKNYKIGFSTLSFIEDKQKVANYISKYVTKELIDLKNKKRYWYSRNLKKPKVYYSYFEGNLKEMEKFYQCLFYKEIIKDNSKITIANYQT